MSVYLPHPIKCGYGLYHLSQKTQLNENDKSAIYDCKAVLFNTVLAVVGYVVARQFSDRLGVTLSGVALGGLLIFPQSAKFAVAGHVCISGLSAAASAAMRKDVKSLTKNLALAAFGYLGSTHLPSTWMNIYVYTKL